jgi:hypothetical protein
MKRPLGYLRSSALRLSRPRCLISTVGVAVVRRLSSYCFSTTYLPHRHHHCPPSAHSPNHEEGTTQSPPPHPTRPETRGQIPHATLNKSYPGKPMTKGETTVDGEVGWLAHMRGAKEIDTQVCWPAVMMVATAGIAW